VSDQANLRSFDAAAGDDDVVVRPFCIATLAQYIAPLTEMTWPLM
jgi:hypothetical protein